MFSASAPGSLMLLGEHAVLHGYPAVACAINRRVTVQLIPHPDDKKIKINSQILGQYETNLSSLFIVKPFHFILGTLLHYKDRLPSGFDLNISSEFSDKLGLGSSAAVTVATLVTVEQWLCNKITLKKIHSTGVNIVRTVQQGMGSGFDIAASTFGGMIAYQCDPFKIEKLQTIPEISLVYSGYKTPTPEVIKKVNAIWKQQPELFDKLLAKIGQCAKKGIAAIRKKNWKQLGLIFVEHQNLQKLLGVSDKTLDSLLKTCTKIPSIPGAKISGAGLGDCIVTLGKLPENYFPIDEKQRQQGILQIDVQITDTGCNEK